MIGAQAMPGQTVRVVHVTAINACALEKV